MKKLLLLSLTLLLSISAFSNIPVYCLDNEKVHAYLSRGTYPDNDYTVSWIMDYCYSFPWDWEGEGHGVRLDQPLPATVKLTVQLTESAKLYVDEDANFTDPLVLPVSAGTDSIDVYNLIPNRTYNWKIVEDPSSEILETGQFQTTGLVRMLKIDGIYNVRDMGGWISELNNKPIKYGKLIRGSRLNVNNESTLLITQDGIKELRRLGIRAELDMRNSSNAAGATHSFLGSDIPIHNVENAYNSRIATFADAPQSIMGIKKLIEWFRQGRPVYMHCSVGADRTGTVAYLVGALCGMSEDALSKDFELTSFSGDKVVNERAEANGDYERLIRQRTYAGRLDPNDNEDSYRFASMVDKIKAFPGNTLHEKVYYHLRTGVDGVSISPEDLSFLVKYLTDYSLLGGVTSDVDTIRLAVGETQTINLTPSPEDAQWKSKSFKSTCNNIATVTDDGVVTATGGGEAYIIAGIDGIEKLIPVIVAVSPSNVPSIAVENQTVISYLNGAHYNGSDYSVSSVESYSSAATSYIKDWPQNLTIKWQPFDGATNQHLYVSDTPDFARKIVDKLLENTDSTYRVEDDYMKYITPQSMYYYKVTASISGTPITLFSSVFYTTGTVNMIKTQKGCNIRDFGGWTGMNGHKVKYGVLYRGARIRANKAQGGKLMITSDDVAKLLDLGILGEIDLRSDDETNASASALDRMSVEFIRISDAIDCQGAKVVCGDAYIRSLQTIINWMKFGGINSVYISSSLGADRTGTLAFLINGLLGVDEESLSKDYELSSFSSDKLDNVLRKRNEGDFPAMVSAIKSLNGTTLQQKIYKYFNEGIYGIANSASISKDDLNWFISTMLGCPVSEVESSGLTMVEERVAPKVQSKIYNLLGQEVQNPGPGIYIMNGKKIVIK